jgi:hypothetical protein
VSLYAHCHSLAQIPDISMVQYNIAILGGPLVTHVNVVFSVLEFQGNQEMRYEYYSRRGQCRRVSNDKSRKGFSTCVEATGRLLRRINTEARTPDRGRCRRSEDCAVMKEPSKNAALSRRGLSKGKIKIALVRWLASLSLFQWITFQEVGPLFQVRIS